MVRFVGGRGTIHRNRLDDVGIDGTLSEPLHFHTRRQLRLYGVGCIVKFVDECSANDFTLLLGLPYACQLPVKPFFSRSEQRRVGQECASTYRYWWSPATSKTK